ncbi:MAG: hypothetical protein R3A44_13350 [Caldilineaceae bacterium]
MKWDYRVFHEKNGDYVIREVFYNEDDKILGCTEDAVEPFGQTLEELAEQIAWFQAALKMPVLTLADIPDKKLGNRPRNRKTNLSQSQLMAELGIIPEAASP